jgi:succinyl-CoA synthetase beta subunit
VAYNDAQAYKAAMSYDRNYMRQYYVKAQVQITSRSKGFFRENGFVSGIHKVSSPLEVKEVTEEMCGKHLINKNTEKAGILCRSVLIMEEVYFTNKFFMSLSFDIHSGSPKLYYSKLGGHPIDRLIKMYPESLRSNEIDVIRGIEPELAE